MKTDFLVSQEPRRRLGSGWGGGGKKKPGDKFMMLCHFPRSKHFSCSAISPTSRPSQKSSAIYSAETDPPPPAAACTSERPAAHLHAASMRRRFIHLNPQSLYYLPRVNKLKTPRELE